MKFNLILTIILIGSSLQGLANTMDSLRMEKIKGKHFIVHRAEPKETLYAIAKRYNVSVSDLYRYNASLDSGLKMYDEILVPSTKKKRVKRHANTLSDEKIHIVEKSQTLFAISKMYGMTVDSLAAFNHLENYNLEIGDTLRLYPVTRQEAAISTPIVKTDTTRKLHTVAASETLFGISRMYQVQIDQIQAWNQIEGYNISIGQVLIVGQDSVSTQNTIKAIEPDTTTIVIEEVSKPIVIDTLYVKTDNSQFKTKTKEVDGEKWVLEEGFAMEIEDTGYTKRYLALHRSAPVGEVIFIKNEMTSRSIEAIVVGPLPENELNSKLLLRLSVAAFQDLGSLDLKMPITTRYAQ